MMDRLLDKFPLSGSDAHPISERLSNILSSSATPTM
jgi:hypothetical protein